MKAKAVYLIAGALILASWLANYGFYRYYRLPEAGFLRHYIETREIPSVAFDLLYVADNGDKRKPVNVQVDELPSLRFHPVQVHQQLSRQTIYRLMGYYDENLMRPREEGNGEPLRLNQVKVYYSDGGMAEEDIGEIVVYRERWPLRSPVKPLIVMNSGSSSSDYEGTATVTLKRPAKLTGVSSAWLEKLGSSFEYELETTAERGAPVHGAAYALPLELRKDQALTLKYRYRMKDSEALSLPVYQILLQANFEEPDGEKRDYTVFANYVPYASEAEMRAYVRGKKEAGP